MDWSKNYVYERLPVGLQLETYPLSFTDSSTNIYNQMTGSQSYKVYLANLEASAIGNTNLDLDFLLDNTCTQITLTDQATQS